MAPFLAKYLMSLSRWLARLATPRRLLPSTLPEAPETMRRRAAATNVKPVKRAPEVLYTWENVIPVHEAGHAITAWFCPIVASISVETDMPTGGIVRLQLYRSGQSDALWSQIVFKLGGIAAECRVFGKFRSKPACDDLAVALEFARELARRGDAWRYGASASPIPFHKIYTSPINPLEHRILNAAYLRARDLVVRHEPRYYRLVSLLMTCKNVTESQMETVLGSRATIRLAGTIGTLFQRPE